MYELFCKPCVPVEKKKTRNCKNSCINSKEVSEQCEVAVEYTTNAGEHARRCANNTEEVGKELDLGGNNPVVSVDSTSESTIPKEDPIVQFQKLFGLVCNFPESQLKRQDVGRMSSFERYVESILAALTQNGTLMSRHEPIMRT